MYIYHKKGVIYFMKWGKIIKKINLILVLAVLVTTLFPPISTKSVKAAVLEENIILNGILSDVDEFKIIANEKDYVIAYAVMGDLKVTVSWNQDSNLITVTDENLNARHISEPHTTSYTIELDENLNLLNNDFNLELRNSIAGSTPISSVLGNKLVEALVAAAVYVTYNGVKYFLMTEVQSTLKKKDKYHYEAILRYRPEMFGYDIFLGPALTTELASSWLAMGKDIWSTSKYYAEKVARAAGNGKTPVLDAPHQQRPGYYWHYHRFDRAGGHSFYY